jgi:hypothetical protein
MVEMKCWLKSSGKTSNAVLNCKGLPESPKLKESKIFSDFDQKLKSSNFTKYPEHFHQLFDF